MSQTLQQEIASIYESENTVINNYVTLATDFLLTGNMTEAEYIIGTVIPDYEAFITAEVKNLESICFMPGTMIATPDGEVAIETLQRGDLVMTTDGIAKPVSWIGRQTISTKFADPVRNLPIRVKAGAIAENVPSRDMLVSPDHALLIDGALIHAGALVNGTTIAREKNVPEIFTYFHVELDDHSLILAANTPAETFVDNVDRRNFDNWAEHEAIYPNGNAIGELAYPRAKAARQVPVATRVKLADRAVALGFSAIAAA